MDLVDDPIPVGILSLPDELLLEIAMWLRPPHGFQPTRSAELARQRESAISTGALYALTLTSHKLYAIMQPILYSSFNETVQEVEELEGSGKATRLVGLIRTLSKNPALGLHIQYAKIISNAQDYVLMSGYDGFVDEVAARLRTRDDEPGQKAASYLGILGFDSDDSYLESHVFPCIHLTTLLHCLSPNLTSLSVIPDAQNSTLSGLYNKACIQDLDIWTTPCQIDIDMLEILRDLYSLALVSSSRFVLRAANIPDMQTGLGAMLSFRIHDLVFDRCEMAPGPLMSTIRQCDLLKSFTCRWGIPVDSRCLRGEPSIEHVDPMPIELPGLNTTLAKHKDTLEHLELDTLESEWVFDMDEEMHTIRSLQHFTSLKTLIVSGLVLFNDNESSTSSSSSETSETSESPTTVPLSSILPHSLEHLTIRVEYDAIVEGAFLTFLQHLQQYRSDFPSLRTIDCTWDPSPATCQKTLVQPFADVGVDLRLRFEEEEGKEELTSG
ncbi:hypothetical protein K491DRAFT_696686 [Lophiostoma macrostomum CBS 122681]|uniref:F-box domain-containing protein n=1 Tax=Lophiostoma macrostomum CBS 122681 TaxID=1314788 RepID=A0A6A6SVX9_9PLEO|nr:hypothetical protein K491DRAFT_696686 [Lophiostoma macrostomum CBS 122681]